MKNSMSILLVFFLAAAPLSAAQSVASEAVNEDYSSTLSLAEKGDQQAQFNLAVMYEDGKVVTNPASQRLGLKSI
jgi:hypothetical protein